MQKIEVGPPSGVRGKRGVLTRLAKDVRGNTLALVGAALLPLMAMVGSSVDIGVAYMAKTRLQSACDSAALAGRRVLVNDTLTDATTDPVRVEATKFFKFNFPDGIYGTTVITPVITKPEAGTLKINATTEIPTSIMHLFGFSALPLSVSCSASQNFVNTDIMLVLDVTGSMSTSISDGNGGNTTRIQSLKDAVIALYDELAPIQTKLEAAGLRLRYGLVPYSSAVNVGKLIRAKDASYMRSSMPYQSRRVANSAPNTISSSNCTATSGGSAHAGSYNSTTKVCTYFVYEQHTIDTSGFLAGSTVDLTPIIGGSTAASTAAVNSAAWSGCVEERETVNTISSTSGYNVPAGATDLSVDLIPSTDANRWAPHWPQVVYPRGGGSTSQYYGQTGYAGKSIIQYDTSLNAAGAYYACPVEAKRLQAWSKADLQTYVNSLLPIGGTYHDIGMIWGARMISDAGVFADSPSTFGSMPVAKHVIFMTDGALAPNPDTYTSYGVEYNDMRVTGSSTAADQLNRHKQRFKMICNEVKKKNVSIWVVAFATASNAELNECASSASQISVSTNKAQLIAKFVEIGKNIGTLRLTQ
jgi:Flp pilus assembly protein TadG